MELPQNLKLNLLHKGLIGKVLGIEQLKQRIPKKIWIISIIESPFQFVKVGVQMFGADLVIGTNNRPLEEAPHPFNGVGVNLAVDPLPGAMVHCLVVGIVIPDTSVSRPFVSVDSLGVRGDVGADECMESFSVQRLDHLQPFAPNVGFVNLYRADKGSRVCFLHGSPDTMAEIPSGAIGYVQGTHHLIGGDTLLGLYHQVDCSKPFS